ncbi:hypothetical protein [Amycolatopsis sp. lyj-346]|uniref:hypothetical protein n=1 Tax=Amycolatopsis sp. lyj-346 TaxID=2789289 RepID=UPI00397800C0
MLTRNWAFFRVLGPSSAVADRRIPAIVPDLVAHLGTADDGGRWYFRRIHEPVPHFGMWFHTRPDVLTELERRLGTRREPDTTGPGADLAWIASEFALGVLRDGVLPAAAQLPVAAYLLDRVAGLVPAADRRSFLFLYWEQWSRGMRPQQRLALAADADAQDAQSLRAAGEVFLHDRHERAVRHYLGSLRQAVLGAPRTPDHPPAYLLFTHAHLTNDCLGITTATEAAAARVLRSALPGGPVPVPPRKELPA